MMSAMMGAGRRHARSLKLTVGALLEHGEQILHEAGDVIELTTLARAVVARTAGGIATV
jgi:hypothetical protein